jgi:hypothetical protein
MFFPGNGLVTVIYVQTDRVDDVTYSHAEVFYTVGMKRGDGWVIFG